MELPNIDTCNRRKAPLLDLSSDVIENGDEKSDIDPENVKKSSCVVTPVTGEIIDGNNIDLIRVAEIAISCGQQSDNSENCDKREEVDFGEKAAIESSKAMAFTIDFSEGKPVDSKKFTNIVERIQKRHRRGVSLSKIDDESSQPIPPAVANKSKPPLKKMEQKSLETDKEVKLRDKSQLSVGRESEMRHSWSPRTSLSSGLKVDENLSKFIPKSTTLQLALKDVANTKEKFKIVEMMTPTDENIDDFVCPQPPLEFDKKDSDNDSVSEAGTYTLDGDNYTEEQKAMMSIDKLPKLSNISCQQQISSASVSVGFSHGQTKQKNQDLEIIDLEVESIEASPKNVFQVTSTHETKPDKPKTSYLEKLKSKVRTIGDRAFHKNKSPDKGLPPNLDIGNFTSITASGVFSKKSALDNVLPPRMARKNSLTKSHIDSSEYIQRSAGNVNEKLLNSYTDYEKARHHDYQLNIFSQDCCTTDIDKENGLSIKTAETKDDWIHEWARNARRRTAQNVNMSRNDRAQSEIYAKQNYQSDEFGDNLERNYSPKSHKNRLNQYADEDNEYKTHRPISPKFSPKYLGRNDQSPNYDDTEFIEPLAPINRFSYSERKENYNIQPFPRPPISPTKIPSPMHSMSRPRSSSLSRSVHSSTTDLDRNDTEMYLHKTAAAISTLQNIHRNSPQSPQSPARPKLPSNFTSSPSIRRNQQRKAIQLTTDDILYGSSQSLHKRNLSLDDREYKSKFQLRDRMSNSYNNEGLNTILNLKQNHIRHNSYEDKSHHRSIDQTFAPQITMRSHISTTNKQPLATNVDASTRTPTSQIKRSSSFSTKQLVRPAPNIKTLTPKLAPKTSNSSLQKSASSNSFQTMTSKYEDNMNNEFYLNDEDDLDPNIYSSESELSDMDNEKELITNTRYNKAFLIRLEQNKQKSAAVQKQGSLACPNTPEMPRRGDARARTSLRDRTSMPRESSLNRMKQDIPALSTTKKALAAKEKEPSKKVVPKYLDISKYKPSQGNTFLKRDESKSTLVNKEIKRSASAFLNKSDVGRSSVRSVKSAVSSTNKQAASNAIREAELAMWRKRASYDPMKAAAEGKKKQELARRSSQQSKYCDNSSVVLRSQSFHSGVGQLNQRANHNDDLNRWTLISTESSEDEFLENS